MKYTHKLPVNEASKLAIHLKKPSLATYGNRHRLIDNGQSVKITYDEAMAYKTLVDHLRELK